jgi:quercetin dioxygenase-like cupin family protein
MEVRRGPDVGPEPAGDEHFTGRVDMAALFTAAGPGELNSHRVHFQPGARTHWHSHPDGQVLYILEGRGRTQVAGGSRTALRAGDAIHVPGGVQHWHGADPDAAMAHLSVTGEGGTVWDAPPVSDDQYDGDPTT